MFASGATNLMDRRSGRRIGAFALQALNYHASPPRRSHRYRQNPADAQSLERTATVIASGIGEFPAIVDAVRTTDQRGIRRLSPFTVPSFLVNLAAGHISIHHGYKGPIGAPVTACAAGVQAIGDAARMIRAGEADVAICGGAEACIDLVSLGGFASARALSTHFNDTPTRASRPFDRDRDGFVMGEGAGILVIEELQHALARQAKPIAEIIGYGTTADAYHVTSGPEDGEGAARAMRLALQQAGLVGRRCSALECPFHLNAGWRQRRTRGDQGRLWPRSKNRGQRNEIGYRPSVGSRRRVGGYLHNSRASRPGRSADPQPRKSG